MTTLPPKRAALPAPRRQTHRGFSLIEVTLALGVASVALITLLGMVPVGLNTFRSAIETTVRTDVTRRIVADMQQTPFSSINSSQSNYFFTDEGTPTSQGAANSVFKVNYTVSSNVSYPGGSSSALKKVTVLFYTQQDQAKNGPATYTNVVYVANNGL